RERVLWGTIAELQAQGRMNEERISAAAEGLWELVHQGYFLEPFFWLSRMPKVMESFPGTYPPIALYRWKVGKRIHPAIVESMLAPKRWWNYMSRQRAIRNGSRTFWG